MFKKASSSGGHALKGSDVKKLRKAAMEALGVDDEALSAVLPPKAHVEMQAWSTPTKSLVFLVDEQPLFFDPNGRGRIFPTVYALWRFPDAMKHLLTHSEVSPKVLGGADLMCPGVIVPADGLPDFEEGDALALRIPENPFPFAVGEAAQSKADAVASGMKGRAIKILHHFPDPLWAAGDKSSPGNGSFRPERVFPLETEDDAEDAGGGVAKKKRSTESTAAEGTNGASPSLASEIGSMSLADDARATRGAPGGAPGAVSSSLPAIDVSTPAGMDAMFERCFLAGLRDKLADADLPMRCELFYANCVLPSRPADVTLDLKKSSFKKQAKLFAVLEKKKLIATKAIHKQDNIVSVNRDHAAYLEYCAAADAAEAAAGASGGGAAGAEPRGADADKASDEASAAAASIDVALAYRASTMYRPIFGDLAVGNKDRLYDAEECANALRSYCVANDLLKGEDDTVTLDTLLGKELFDKKEAEGPGTEMPLRLVLPRLIKKLQLHTKVRVVRRGEAPKEVTLKRHLHPIKARVENRGGRKFLTTVSGLEDFAVDPAEFSAKLQRAFSCSASSQRLPGKNETGVEISVQGNVLKELVAMLKDEFGIPPKFIEAEDKTK